MRALRRPRSGSCRRPQRWRRPSHSKRGPSRLVAGHLRRFRRAGGGAEPVGLLLQRRFERDKGVGRVAVAEKHGAKELARRRERAWCYGAFLGFVLGVRCGRHGLQRLGVAAFGVEHPSTCGLPLDVDLVRPIVILRFAQPVAKLGQILRCPLSPVADCRSGRRRERARNR